MSEIRFQRMERAVEPAPFSERLASCVNYFAAESGLEGAVYKRFHCCK